LRRIRIRIRGCRMDLSKVTGKEFLSGVLAGAGALLVGQHLYKVLVKKPRQVKVTYFKMAGRAGPVRAALQLAKIKYENVFVNRESFNAMKPKLPFGQVPVFEVNGEVVSQSNAFLRYVGRFSSLYPTDPFKALKVDEVLDGISDALLVMRPSLMEKDLEKKLQLRKELISPDGALTKFMTNMQKLVESNKGSYAAGSQMSIADLSLYTMLKMINDGGLDGIPPSVLGDYPLLKNIFENINTLNVSWE